MTRLFFSLLVCSLFACSKKESIANAPLPIDSTPVPDCSLLRMVLNPEASRLADRDTVFFDKGLIRQATVPGGGLVTYTYQQGQLWQREQFDRAGQVTTLSRYEHNLGAGQLIFERKLNPEKPSEREGTTEFSYGPYGSETDRIKEINYYNGRYQLQKRFVVNWDPSLRIIQSVSERNGENYPVADYHFSGNEAKANPFHTAFPFAVPLFLAEPSGYPEAIKIGLLCSQSEITNITANLPGFQPLHLTYAFNARGNVKDVTMNGVPVWRFGYLCE